jgi:hypothetical protein
VSGREWWVMRLVCNLRAGRADAAARRGLRTGEFVIVDGRIVEPVRCEPTSRLAYAAAREDRQRRGGGVYFVGAEVDTRDEVMVLVAVGARTAWRRRCADR